MMASSVAWTLGLPFVIVTAYLCLELAKGLKPLSRKTHPVPSLQDVVVLIPAHNEEATIADCVTAVLEEAPAVRILVIADNCTDETVTSAREAGAEVTVRSDPNHRGKGFALAFGREHLRSVPPEIVVVLDADCRISADSIERLAAEVLAKDRPIQSANLLVSEARATPLQEISNFAMLVKNLVRARGLMRIGGGISLFGTGMAFPWKLFAQLPLATSDVVEDLALGIQLAKDGLPVELEDRALVTSLAANPIDNLKQRQRWEHGFLQQAFRNAFPLLVEGFRRRSLHLLALGAHMLVPPLALHVVVGIAILVVTTFLWWAGGSALPMLLVATAMVAMIALLLLAWISEGRDTISLTSLLLAPAYVLWKIPIYLAFLVRRQSSWNRSRRPNE